MAELLTLSTPETKPTITTWRVRSFFLDPDAPSIKTEYMANTGETRVWRYIVDPDVTLAQVNGAISYINQGKYMSVQGKSLQRFLIDEAQTRGIFGAGAISGTVV